MNNRGEKVAYYCSELGSHQTASSDHYSRQSSNNNNNNNNNTVSKSPYESTKPQHYIRNDSDQANSEVNGGQSTNSSVGDYPRINSRFEPNQQIEQSSIEQQQQQKQQSDLKNVHTTQFVHNQILTAPHQQSAQTMNPTATTSQPQYLISNSNPQHMTNLTPHHFNQQHNSTANNNNNPSFQPGQMHQASGYHINSNHHLYQSGMVPQQLPQQARASLFQPHHRSPSQSDTEKMHPKIQNNQVIFHDSSKQNLVTQEQGMNRVQIASHPNHQIVNSSEQSSSAGLISSQSMTHNDFNRVRRQSEQLGLAGEGGVENLNLDFESMLMIDGRNNNNNNTHIMQKQHPQANQDINKILKTLVNQQGTSDNNSCCDKQNNVGSDMSSTGYGRPAGHQSMVCPSKDSLFMQENTEDNIYEEIDSKAINRLQADYPIDTMSLHSDTWKKKNSKKFLGASFTRWFSTRKKSSNSQNSDQEENPYMDSKSCKRPRIISLPKLMTENLTPEKLKRRLIVSSIVDSENSYTNSLYRLIYEYKKPLEEADPPILSANKISIIFFCLDQILQFHRIFGIALNQYVQEWDEKETIGYVFTNSFSKAMVLDIYSGFINNFTNAMETARRASKSKAFAQFLHDKSVTSPDRLSFFGSMVKPVQRFPQFILLLSDLLKHTPFNHPDRMPLQTALTELESLADRLNERKRDAERHFAVKQLLKDHLNESNSHSQRFLLRQDDTCLLDMDQSTNSILKSKNRKMYLLNDMLICVSNPSNRLKFAIPLCDISVIESITPAISNILAHSNLSNISDPATPSSPQNFTIERMEYERQSLVHDLELMTRIAALVASLRFQYNGLDPLVPEQICLGIRDEIRKKEFQMTLIDRSCLQLRLHSKSNKDTLVVQFSNPEAKRDWLIDVRLTKLALDRANNPGWENVADNPPPTHQASLCSIGQRVPLFVKSLAIFKLDQSNLTCALHYFVRQAPFIGENPAGVLWICNVNAGASSLGALATNGAEVSLIHSFELSDSHVTCLESVGSTLWIGLRQGRIIVIDANSPSLWIQFASLDVQAEVTCIRYFGHFVYVGLITGFVAVFDAINFDKPLLVQLSQMPVTFLLPVNDEVFACSHNKIWRIKETNIIDSLVVQNDNIIPLDEEPRPNLLAHCGSGLWVSLIDSPIVKLYHAETLKHLQDINVGMSIRRVLNDFKDEIKVTVTSMIATRGLLWIGTNVGMIATLTLPRLQGVPLVSGSINVALHRFLGSVNIMLNLSAGSECVPQLPFDNNKQPNVRVNYPTKNEDAEAIYGQYADLMNVGDYITSGRKSGVLSDTPATSMAWDFGTNPNLAGLNVTDDSNSSASSGAIYQDGVPRGMKQVQNKAVISNTVQIEATQQQMSQQSAGGPGMIPQQAQQNQFNDLANQIRDNNGQTVGYNPGSLNGNMVAPTTSMQQSTISEGGMSLDRQQNQQRQMSASQTQLSGGAAKFDQQQNASNATDYGSQKSASRGNKIYDQPTQIPQHQQVIQQARPIGNQIDNSMLNMQAKQPQAVPGYGAVAGKPSQSFLSNKTVLVLAGGNGYQRMALGDDEPFGKDAHCIIWEYKA